jgi:sigma-B regulation protein RsbU (phosphoserine phosphatase)
MYRIQCAQIWGGIRNEDQDVCSEGITASLHSSSCDGGKGGDIYYLSVCASDMLTRIAIADVVGHGQAVSDVSQFIYDALESHMNDAAGNNVLAEVNDIAATKGLDAMTTAAVVAYYTSDNHLHFAYAGHHPALVKRMKDSVWFSAELGADGGPPLESDNLPLAVLPQSTFDQRSMPLETGDRIFVYTDGVIEAPDPDGVLFGEYRLMEVLNESATAPLSEVKSAVLEALRRHVRGPLIHDDVTLLAMEVN